MAGVLENQIQIFLKKFFRRVKLYLQACGLLVIYSSKFWRPNRRLSLVSDEKKTIVLQVDSFDKGGLEEVVLTLAKNLPYDSSLNVFVFVTSSMIGYLGDIARRQGIKVIALKENLFLLRWLIRLFKVRLVNLQYSTFGTTEYSRAHIPIAYTIQNTYIWADPLFISRRLEAYSHVAKFIAVSEPVADFFAERFKIDPSRIVTIPNGLDLEYVNQQNTIWRSLLGLSEDDIVFLNVASFNWDKCHILMVAAMERLIRRLPNAKLLFIGNTHDAECHARVKQDILRYDLKNNIQTLDYMPKASIVGLMKQADCFILPSLIEGWSIAVMEAMYCGLPLILSDVGSARALINNNDIGIIIRNPFSDIQRLSTKDYMDSSNFGNLEDLVTAMETIGRNKEDWKKRAKAGREKIISGYFAKHMCDQYISCFKSVVSLG